MFNRHLVLHFTTHYVVTAGNGAPPLEPLAYHPVRQSPRGARDRGGDTGAGSDHRSEPAAPFWGDKK